MCEQRWRGCRTARRGPDLARASVTLKYCQYRTIALARETFISPTQGFSDSYAADLLEFELRPRTIDELAEIGVRSNAKAVQDLYPDMPVVSKGWPEFAAHFGGEGLGHVNIGLGRVPALQIFNDATVKWREIVR